MAVNAVAWGVDVAALSRQVTGQHAVRCWFGFHAYVRDVATDEKWLEPTAQIWRLWTGSPPRDQPGLNAGPLVVLMGGEDALVPLSTNRLGTPTVRWW